MDSNYCDDFSYKSRRAARSSRNLDMVAECMVDRKDLVFDMRLDRLQDLFPEASPAVLRDMWTRCYPDFDLACATVKATVPLAVNDRRRKWAAHS